MGLQSEGGSERPRGFAFHFAEAEANCYAAQQERDMAE